MQNFITYFFQPKRLKLTFWLFSSLLFSVALVAARNYVGGNHFFRFLIWNLFLAFIPYLVSSWLIYYTNNRKNILVIGGATALWLLFFPNAPYILTDLFHLRPRTEAPYWYDLLLILSFAWNGLILAYVSLAQMQQIFSKIFNKMVSWLFVITSLCLSAFGIYLGRYLRWNSWDIITNPQGLAFDILDRFIHPFAHGRTWYMTLGFSAFLIVGYFTIKQLGKLAAQTEQ
jgi:uncharacterized membrane protein